MDKCSCYRERNIVHYSPIFGRQNCVEGYCTGTKECDECQCDGDMSKCDFYPEVRQKVKKELNTAEMWLAAQEDGETYETDYCDTYYSKDSGFLSKDKTSYYTTPSLNDWMNAMWHKQERRRLTKEEAEKEFDIKIVD